MNKRKKKRDEDEQGFIAKIIYLLVMGILPVVGALLGIIIFIFGYICGVNHA